MFAWNNVITAYNENFCAFIPNVTITTTIKKLVNTWCKFNPNNRYKLCWTINSCVVYCLYSNYHMLPKNHNNFCFFFLANDVIHNNLSDIKTCCNILLTDVNNFCLFNSFIVVNNDLYCTWIITCFIQEPQIMMSFTEMHFIIYMFVTNHIIYLLIISVIK